LYCKPLAVVVTPGFLAFSARKLRPASMLTFLSSFRLCIDYTEIQRKVAKGFKNASAAAAVNVFLSAVPLFEGRNRFWDCR
jgi:hypothetical protein